jgi:hypothetical protein
MNDLTVKADTAYGLPSAGMAPGLAIMFNDKLYDRCKDIARIMSESRGFVPVHLTGKTHACFAIVVNSITWRLNPFAVASSTYETPGGRVGYEGKLVQAILENSGQIEGPVTYELIGEWSRIQGRWKKLKGSTGKEYAAPDWQDKDEEGLGVIVRAKVRGENQPRELTVMMRECFPRNSTLWALRPSQQICYTACRAFANVAAPGIFMGVPFSTDLEAEEMVEVNPLRPARDDFKDSASAAAAAAVVEVAASESDSQPLHDNEAAAEYSVADAFDAGRKARRDGKALRAVPPEWRDNPATQAFAEGWQEGWRAEDEDMSNKG